MLRFSPPMRFAIVPFMLMCGLVPLLVLAEEGARQQAETLDTTVPVKLKYLLAVPADLPKQEKWPLLLFLHGSGERGDDLNKVKVHGPPKLIEQGQEFPFIVVSPQCPAGRRWEPIELVALMDEVSRKLPVDPDRVYVTGLSMGGFGTWQLASFAPERIAAIAPICGGGEKYWAKQIAGIPVWAFHGAKDAGVPLHRSEEMVNAVKQAGGTAQLTVYPEAGHDSWTETYNNPELYTWLLAQRRGSKGE